MKVTVDGKVVMTTSKSKITGWTSRNEADAFKEAYEAKGFVVSLEAEYRGPENIIEEKTSEESEE